jgi:hypothetical protein
MSYDEWKTTDKEYEAYCEWWEGMVSLLDCDTCGNDDPDFFNTIKVDTHPEGGCDVQTVSAICWKCGTEFIHTERIDPRELH